MAKQLYKKYSFANFNDAYECVQQIAALAEEDNHHPDIKFGWGYVEVWLMSHDVGEVTDKDRAMMDKIEDIINAQ